MIVRLDPPRGVDLGDVPLTLGMSRADATAALTALGEPSSFRRHEETHPSLVVTDASGLTVFAYLDAEDRVDAVELGRPSADIDRVEYRGVDIFGSGADEVVARLRTVAGVEVEEHPDGPRAPGLHLAFWRDDPEQVGFEAVLVARPGYGHG